MTNYRKNLPQLGERIFLTDGGIETTLIFQEHIDLPYFAAFALLSMQQGRESLKRYYEPYASMAVHARTGFVLESPTWRASSDWGEKLGYSQQKLHEINKNAIGLLNEIRAEYQVPTSPFVISGCVGPRGDGYAIDESMSADQAEDYHRAQIASFADSEADLVTAITMTYSDEAIGITRAAQKLDIPAVISFTTEIDGRLPSGESLKSAIDKVDAATDDGPAYYMINCAHPDHFLQALADNARWVQRIRGVRANASRKSHAELDESEELDAGNPQELGQQYRVLRERFPTLTVLGGCCGTDHRHLGAICKECA